MDWIRPCLRLFWFGCFLITFGCGSDSSTHQSSAESFPTVDMTGTWSGTATSSATGVVKNVTLVLEQAGTGASGSYTCTDGPIACIHTEGTFSASVVKSTFTGGVVFTDITPNGPSCTLHGSVSGATLTAEYSCNPTSREEPGAWDLTRQGG